MTVTTFLNYKEYQADGVGTRFSIPFLLLNEGDLNVLIDNQLLSSGYSITGIGNAYGEIIFDSPPKGILLLQRVVRLLRETDYQENGDLLADTLNRDFDRLYLAMQGVSQDVSKSLRVIDAEGVSVLPKSEERANKFLSFNSVGQPELVTVDSDSSLGLAQKLRNTNNLDEGSGLIGYSKSISYPETTIGNTVNQLTKKIDDFEGNGVPLFSVSWWPSRENIPAGYIAADGQELSQIIFPDAADSIRLGKVPVISELEWKNDPLKRTSYVIESSDGMFRVPDYNGQYADSLGVFYPMFWFSGAVSEENKPVNILGCWVIKLFTSVVNASTANIQQLVTENTKLASRVSLLEGAQSANRFTIIYPNGGTEEKPANITNNQYYVMDNPFPNQHVICVVELLLNGNWGDPGWVMIYAVGGGSYGVKAAMLNTDKIIVRTGSARITGTPIDLGAAHPDSTPIVASAPCRVKVWRAL